MWQPYLLDHGLKKVVFVIVKKMKLLSEEDEEAILKILANEIPTSVLTSFPALHLRANGSVLKKTYLCPNCGKWLSGLTSLKRHLVRNSLEFSKLPRLYLVNILTYFHNLNVLADTYWRKTI